MLISDHLNFTGQSCLAGPAAKDFGKQFVDLSYAYNREWRQRYIEQSGATVTGVYAGMLGPAYETFAETKWLASTGATMVGMSTVQECLAARQLGVHVLGFSLVTNLAAGLSEQVDHDDVLAVGKAAGSQVSQGLQAAILSALG